MATNTQSLKCGSLVCVGVSLDGKQSATSILANESESTQIVQKLIIEMLSIVH